MGRVSRRMRLSVTGLVFLAFAAVAATVSINASAYPYTKVPAAQDLTAYEMVDLRIAGLTGLVGMYRSTYGIYSLPVGTKIKVTWGDGSVEEALVACLSGTPCVQPIPGTQKPPSEGGGGLGSGTGNGRGQGVGTGGGANPPGGSYGGGGWTGTVSAGPGSPLPKLPKGSQEI